MKFVPASPSAARIVSSIILVFVLSACGMVESVKNMSRQTEAASTEIEQRIGNKPQINWNMSNGRLVQVNVYFDRLSNRNITLAEMEEAVQDSIYKALKQKPKQLLITLDATDREAEQQPSPSRQPDR